MLVSVIVPIYYGKKYIPDILGMLERNLRHTLVDFKAELIFINDSPDEVIYEDELKICTTIIPTLIVNEENRGIHYSRVRGLRKACGEYILFLDQDDQIEDNYFESQLKHIRGKDIVVANGIVQYPSYEKLLYRYWIMQWTVKHKWFYVRFDSRIISPGQCLIKSSSIPAIWKENIVGQNGADDYFLWMIMLTRGCRFAINRERLYTHVYTAVNTSADLGKMRESVREILQKSGDTLRARDISLINNRICRANTGADNVLIRMIEKINRRR